MHAPAYVKNARLIAWVSEVAALTDSQRIEVRQLHLEAGSAQADLNFSAQRAPQAAWQLRSSGRLSDFDPLPWWPGEEGGAWRSGPHRLSGNWSLDLLLPRITPGLSQPALLQSVVASGTLGIERSVIAGVPVSLQLALTHHTGDGPAPSTAKGELVVGGNRVVIDGQGNPLGDGRQDASWREVMLDDVDLGPAFTHSGTPTRH